MHKLLAVSVMLFMSMNAMAAKSTPQLISFQKLMSLTPQKRMAYVSGVAKLLAKMEAQQLENEKNSDMAWEVREMREKLVAMFAILPEAEAADGAWAEKMAAAKKKQAEDAALARKNSEAAATGNWSEKMAALKRKHAAELAAAQKNSEAAATGNWSEKMAALKRKQAAELAAAKARSEAAATNNWAANMAAAKRKQVGQGNGAIVGNPITTQQAEQKDLSGGTVTYPYAADTAVDTKWNDQHGVKSGKIQDRMIQEGDEAATPPVQSETDDQAVTTEPAPPEPAPVVDSKCQEELPITCTASEQAKKDARRNIGRSKHRDCISGGAFSKYPKVVKPGGCKLITGIKFKDKDGGVEANCDAGTGTALCDPYMFCAKYADGKKVTTKNFPIKCMKTVFKGQADLTARCDAWYNSDKLKSDGLMKCDPDEAPIEGKKEKWDEMRAAFKKAYSETCAVEADYKILYCEECQTMAKYVGDINAKATGTRCADAGGVTADDTEHGPGYHKGTQ